MSSINEQHTISLAEAADLILNCRDTRFLLRGEPGIGKTSLTKRLQEETGMDAAIISVPDMDLGDVAMPVIDHKTKTTTYYPNARFKLQDGKPLIIVLDEYTKGTDAVKNMLHPMLETFRPRLGDIPIPEGSIIYLTGNLEEDGVGDSMRAHTRARLTAVTVRKPSAEEFCLYAMNEGFHPVVIAWSNRNSHAFASYIDGYQDGNELIFNPKKVQDGYVCPRTLEIASRILKGRGEEQHKFGYAALTSALCGTLGASGGESMMAFLRHHDELPPWEDIIKHPTTTRVPNDPGALAVLTFGAVERVKSREELEAFGRYIQRVDEEWQAIFCLATAKHPAKQPFLMSSKQFAEWVVKNADLL